MGAKIYNTLNISAQANASTLHILNCSNTSITAPSITPMPPGKPPKALLAKIATHTTKIENKVKFKLNA